MNPFTKSIPALRSFCIYCAVGIATVYLFQTCWFVAWMVIDERRRDSARNAFLPCIVHSNSSPSKGAHGWLDRLEAALEKIPQVYGTLLCKGPVQVSIVVLTAALFALSLYGNYLLEQEFDPWKFLSPEAPILGWKRLLEAAFPENGEKVLLIFEGNGTGPMDLTSIDRLTRSLQNQTDIVTKFSSWYLDLDDYNTRYFSSAVNDNSSSLLSLGWPEVARKLERFLFSVKGARHKYLFDLDGDLHCGGPMPGVRVRRS